jgi:hypothetical protein
MGDFCDITESETGAPGTTTCVSNCGNDIIQSNPPASQIRIAYFEAWNENRPCLHMRVDDIDKSRYTHIHFAFAEITPDTFQVDVSKVQQQFDMFKAMTGIKKIISFGGWDFSVLLPTYRILRTAVLPENRGTFGKNLLKFVQDHNLDGIDLDWEYPGVILPFLIHFQRAGFAYSLTHTGPRHASYTGSEPGGGVGLCRLVGRSQAFSPRGQNRVFCRSGFVLVPQVLSYRVARSVCRLRRLHDLRLSRYVTLRCLLLSPRGLG